MLSSAARHGYLKSSTTVGLVLRAVTDRFSWPDYVSRLRSHVYTTYRVELPEDRSLLAQWAQSPQSLIDMLIDRLGQQTAVLSVYKTLEDLIADEVVAEGEPAPSQVEEEQEKEQEEQEKEEEEEKEKATTTTAVAPIDSDFSDQEGEEEDNEQQQQQQDGQNNPAASDADSDYHSGDGGQPSEGGPGRSSPAVPPPPSPVTASAAISFQEEEEEEPLLPQESGDESDPGHDASSVQCPHDSDAGERQLGEDTIPSQSAADTVVSTVVEPTGPHLLKCVERQAMILTSALKEAQLSPDNGMPLTIEAVQRQLERFIFNPDPKVPREHQEPRYNFYPPFQIPKAIANYHIFAVTAPIPQSCKANRSGTELLQSLRTLTTLKRLPRWKYGTTINDSLGEEVAPITELQDVKLVPLRDDLSRLQWAKMRGDHIRYFCYPSLHMPPKITRMLMETLMQPFADESVRDDYPAPSISDEEIMCIIDPDGAMSPPARAKAVETRRNMIALAVRYTTQLELMERVFREPSSIKKTQEVLHHTFHHGFVSLIRETAKVNLSNYSTFHGCTYNDPLNNCMIAKLMEGADKQDFLVDSIYLFLVLTWQTAMGMWQQAIDDNTVKMYAEVFEKQRRALYALDTVTAISKAIVDILMDGDRLCHEMRKALPNFTTMSQIDCFRQFVMERSNIPSMAAPFMPSDFVPLTYRQSQPLLWDQVYLLQLAFFLNNHGGYLWEPQDPENSTARDKAYCPCNLCSPHRMPQHNVALHNEMLAINTFEIRSAEGKTFKLTPELWTNAYLDKFVAEDYHPFEVRHFADNQAGFSKDMTACVTTSPEILSLIRQIQASREEFLLTRGKGVYKDPQTGEPLTPQPALHTGAKQLPALPAAETDPARGTAAPAKPPRALRLAHAAVPTGGTTTAATAASDNGTTSGPSSLPAATAVAAVPGADHDGPEDGGREDSGFGASSAAHGGSGLYYDQRTLQSRGGDRFRRGNLRKRGYRFGDESDLRRGPGGPGGRGSRGGGGGGPIGGGRGRRGQREQSSAPYDPPQTQAPKYILPRAPLLGTPAPPENSARVSGGSSGTDAPINPSAP